MPKLTRNTSSYNITSLMDFWSTDTNSQSSAGATGISTATLPSVMASLCMVAIWWSLLQCANIFLQELYESHQGTLCTKIRAKLIIFWPGINNNIENVVLSCKQCQDNLPSHPKEPLITKPRPPRPFQEIAVDFCSHAGHDFLTVVDCHTGWPDIIHMGRDTTATKLNKTLLGIFCRTGVPDAVWSDEGPQFTFKPFKDFSTEWGFHHYTSSPRYPQSNGKAESTVKSMKKII